MSGITPEAVYGISACSTTKPNTPFWPCLEENLSPNSGILKSRTFILTNLLPSTVSEIITVSTIPCSLCRIFFEVSRLFGCISSNSSYDFIKRGGEVLPIRTSPPFTCVSGSIIPSTSDNNLYDSADLKPRTPLSGISNLSTSPPGYFLSSAS